MGNHDGSEMISHEISQESSASVMTPLRIPRAKNNFKRSSGWSIAPPYRISWAL